MSKAEHQQTPRITAYVCGPITGLPNENREAFENAAKRLAQRGFKAHNPHTVPEHAGRIDESWEGYMRRDIPYLCQSDIVVTLPNWANSRGASIEVDLATKLNIPVIDIYQAIDMPLDNIQDMIFETSMMKHVPLHNILATISRITKIDTSNICGRSRKRPVAAARMLYYYFATKIAKHASTTTGRLVDRDHSTVIIGAKRVQDLLDVRDQQATEAVRELTLHIMKHATH